MTFFHMATQTVTAEGPTEHLDKTVKFGTAYSQSFDSGSFWVLHLGVFLALLCRWRRAFCFTLKIDVKEETPYD
jgi:hypothetical protein